MNLPWGARSRRARSTRFTTPAEGGRRHAWSALPVVFLLVFLVYPVAHVVSLGVCGTGPRPALDALLSGGDACAGGLTTFLETLTRGSVRERLAFTVFQALASTALTLAIALPSAHAFARRAFPFKTTLRAVLTVPFVLPAVVVALAFLALFGRNGLLPLDLPPLMLILLAHAFYNYAVVVRLVGGVWARLSPRYAEAAGTLGASPLRAFLTVELPLLLPAVAAASVLVFVFTFTSFGIILIIGGPEYATIEVSIYEAFRQIRFGTAAALALLQAAFTFAAMSLYARLQEKAAVPVHLVAAPASGGAADVPLLSRRGITSAIALLAGMLLVVAPVLALVVQSFRTGDAWTLSHYANIGRNVQGVAFHVSPHDAAWNSLRFAAWTAAIALPLGFLSAMAIHRSRRGRATLLDALLMLPLGVSAVTLGVGFMRAFNEPPLDLRATAVAIVIAHVLIAYPFTTRAVLAGARAMSPRLTEAAATLGAPPATTFRRVLLPLLAPGLIVGAVFAVAVSLGEFGATLVLHRPEHMTLPLLVFRNLGRPGPFYLGQALALATILMLMTVLLFIVLERFRWKDIGEF